MNKKMKEKYIAPIRIDLPDLKRSISIGKIKLRKITEKEKIKYLNICKATYTENGDVSTLTQTTPSTPYVNSLDLFEDLKLKSCQHTIECTDEKIFTEELNMFLLSLRLYRDGNVFAPIIFNPDAIGIHYVYPQFIQDTEKYTIYLKEFNQIKNIFSLIKQNEVFSLIFDRFNNALSKETNKKNSFIDLVTILESLFLKNNDKQELAFRFSLYTSFILKNKLKSKASFEEMKNIYSVRSQLVHSGKSKNYSKELLNKTKKYTKILLLWTLKNPSLQEKDYKNMVLSDLKINP